MKWTPLRRVCDRRKPLILRKRRTHTSVMGQEKSARGESTSLLVFLLPSLRIIAPWINFWPSFLSFFLLLLLQLLLMVSSTNFAAPSTLNRDVIKMTIQSFHFAAIILIYHLRSLTCQRNSHFSNIFYKRKDRQSTVFENLRKKSHSTLRAKNAMFTFWVDKSSLKTPKNG